MNAQRGVTVILTTHDLGDDVAVDGATVIAREGHRVTYRFGRFSASALIQKLAARYRIADLTVREPEIENTVKRIYEERLLSPERFGATAF